MRLSFARYHRRAPVCFALLSIGFVEACGSSGEHSGAGGRDGGRGGSGAGIALSGSVSGVELSGSAGGCPKSGCVCVPLTGQCANGKATMCLADGSGTIAFDCDPVQGMVCNPDGCSGTCAPAQLGKSYIGCDYLPTVTLNPVWSGFDFAVAVSNTASTEAKVTVTQGTAAITTQTVQPGAVAVIKLPWVTALKGGDVDACQDTPDPGASRVVTAGAYRLRSNNPVTVYQYSPLEYILDPTPGCPTDNLCSYVPADAGVNTTCLAYTADSSLLLPTNVLSGSYTAMSWPGAGFIAVTAASDNTSVTVLGLGQLVPSVDAGMGATGGTVTLNAGDVLEVVGAFDTSAGATSSVAQNSGADISGTRIQASKPVQVIAGHSCARVPTPTTGYCDHLESSMFPDETLGSDYLVTYPGAAGQASPHLIRIAATSAGSTTVHFDPPISPDVSLTPGTAPLEIGADPDAGVAQDVHITANHPIVVAQYMRGSTVTPQTTQDSSVQWGDPSLSLAIPTPQFRSSYLFYASHTYDYNYVNVIATTGTTVTLDQTAIDPSEFSPIGTTKYSVARHLLTQSDVHSISGSSAFGIVVYGYGQYTSYMYPGGLNLNYISPTPIIIK